MESTGRHSPPFPNDADHIIQEIPAKFQPHGESVAALGLEMRLDLSPYLAISGREGDVGRAPQASKETVHIVEGVSEAPEQRLEVSFDVDISALDARIGNGFGQLS